MNQSQPSNRNDNEDLLDIAHRISLSGKNSYIALQEELIRLTGANICACFLSEDGFVGDYSCGDKITTEEADANLEGLRKKLIHQKNRKLGANIDIKTPRHFWKKHNRNINAFALILGASEKLSKQLAKKDYYLVVKAPSNIKCEPYRNLSFEGHFNGNISQEQIVGLERLSSTSCQALIQEVLSLSEYHLLPPFSFSVISIPIGFCYSFNLEEEIVSIALAWFGMESSYEIDLDKISIDRAVKLCNITAHKIIVNSIDPFYSYWRFNELKKALIGKDTRPNLSDVHFEALELLLIGKSSREITDFLMEKYHPWAKSTAKDKLTQLYKELTNKINPKIPTPPRDATLVRTYLMDTEFYLGPKV
jgi:hypothetical protein